MFLNQLSNKEKESFLKLSYVIATKDGEYADEEKNILIEYANEMDIELEDLLFVGLPDEIELIKGFSLSNEKIIKEVFIELVSLAFIDEKYKDEEDKLLRLYMKEYNFDEEYFERVKKWVSKMNSVYLELAELI